MRGHHEVDIACTGLVCIAFKNNSEALSEWIANVCRNERRHSHQTHLFPIATITQCTCPHMVKHKSSLMEVRVHRLPSISCLSLSISCRFSLGRCMMHAATTLLALSFQPARAIYVVVFGWRVFRVIYLCILHSWFRCGRSVFRSSARLSHQDAAGRNSSLVGGTGVSTPVGAARLGSRQQQR